MDNENGVEQRDMDIIYYDNRGIMDAIDKGQSLDLSLHLYSAHLMHRDFYLRNYPHLLNPAEPNNPYNRYAWHAQPKHINKETRFPHASFVNWPYTGSTNVVQRGITEDAIEKRLDHQVRTPRTNNVYVNTSDPTSKPLGRVLPASLLADIFKSDPVDDSVTSKRLKRAAEVLAFELDAAYQRRIHKQIHKMGKSAVIDPVPELGPQSKAYIFQRLTKLLDRVAKDSAVAQKSSTAIKLQWKEFLAHDMCTGDTLERCRRLFIERVGRFDAFKPLKLDNQYLSLLDCSELPLGTDKNADIKRVTYCKPVPVTNQELLDDMLVPVPGPIPPEYHKTYSLIRKNKRFLDKKQKRLNKMKQYRSIAHLNDSMASDIERDFHDWSTDPRTIIYLRLDYDMKQKARENERRLAEEEHLEHIS